MAWASGGVEARRAQRRGGARRGADGGAASPEKSWTDGVCVVRAHEVLDEMPEPSHLSTVYSLPSQPDMWARHVSFSLNHGSHHV